MQINNYRPVSVLAFISKIFERIMYNKIIEFVNKHNILYKYQFGLREKPGPNTALIVLIDKISTAICNACDKYISSLFKRAVRIINSSSYLAYFTDI